MVSSSAPAQCDLVVLLTIELNEPDEWRKRQFHESLVECSWLRFAQHSDTWCAGFSTPITESEAIGSARQDVQQSAVRAGIKEWHAVCQASPWAPVTFSIDDFDQQETANGEN